MHTFIGFINWICCPRRGGAIIAIIVGYVWVVLITTPATVITVVRAAGTDFDFKGVLSPPRQATVTTAKTFRV